MRMRWLAKRNGSRLVALALLSLWAAGCHRRAAEPLAAILPAGEPEVYSATVTRTVGDGQARDETASLVARRGDWRREQWDEAAGARALVWRPDLGKGYLLDLSNRLYVEFAFAASPASGPPPVTHESIAAPAATEAPAAIDAGEVDRALNDAPAPVQTETRVLADQTVQGHPCQVIEERATRADGRVEITRSRRARDLAGLPLLVEVESANGARVTIERRDIRLDVSEDDFAVPPGFRKVERLPATAK